MNKRTIYTILISFICIIHVQESYSQTTDRDKLEMAVAYFQSSKYHESLLLFKDLDDRYTLNTRFKAYIGVCYYYESDYNNATQYLDSVMTKIDDLAPHERSIYYFINAESHFNLQQYDRAIPLYEKMLLVCYDNDKPDALYQIGLCYTFIEDWHNARDYLNSALKYYNKYKDANNRQARIAQVENMIKGCDDRIAQEDTTHNKINQ